MGYLGLDQEQCGHAPAIAMDVPNLYLDTSQTADNPEAAFDASTRQVGVGRVLFGSDAPVISSEVNLKKLEVAIELFGLVPVRPGPSCGRTHFTCLPASRKSASRREHQRPPGGTTAEERRRSRVRRGQGTSER